MRSSKFKSDTICGLSIDSKKIDQINEDGEINIDGTNYDVYVGPCNSEIPPHFHIISNKIHLIIGIPCDSDINIIESNNFNNLDVIKLFLKKWLPEENHIMTVLSSQG